MLTVAPRLDAASARALPADPEMRVVPTDKMTLFEQKETLGENLPRV